MDSLSRIFPDLQHYSNRARELEDQINDERMLILRETRQLAEMVERRIPAGAETPEEQELSERLNVMHDKVLDMEQDFASHGAKMRILFDGVQVHLLSSTDNFQRRAIERKQRLSGFALRSRSRSRSPRRGSDGSAPSLDHRGQTQGSTPPSNLDPEDTNDFEVVPETPPGAAVQRNDAEVAATARFTASPRPNPKDDIVAPTQRISASSSTDTDGEAIGATPPI